MKPLRKANRIIFKEKLYAKKAEMIKNGEYVMPSKGSKVDKLKKNKKNTKPKEKKTKNLSVSMEDNVTKDESDVCKIDMENINGNDNNKNDEENSEKIDEMIVNNFEGELNMEGIENERITEKDDDRQQSSMIKGGMKYEENKLMTCVQGFWIRRTHLSNLEAMKKKKIEKIKNNRENDLPDSPLTREEEIQLQV